MDVGTSGGVKGLERGYCLMVGGEPDIVAYLEPVFSALAPGKDSPLCRATVEVFASILGSEAGNLALKVLAVGGLYLGGGIAPKILKKMRDGVLLCIKY